MKTINIRGIDDGLYETIKEKSSVRGVSMNRLIIESLENLYDQKKFEYDDMDDLLGIWSEEDALQVAEAVSDSRKIDDELWS